MALFCWFHLKLPIVLALLVCCFLHSYLFCRLRHFVVDGGFCFTVLPQEVHVVTLLSCGGGVVFVVSNCRFAVSEQSGTAEL